jgi:hypothetical protein
MRRERNSEGTEGILVQIPSYRDSQLVPTLESLLNKAISPERLSICVCWQRGLEESLPRWVTRHPSIRILEFDYRESRGVGWARRLLQRQWAGEPYVLLVDSHTRFVRHWDRHLKSMMLQLKGAGVAKPVLSCLPPSFYRPETYPGDRDSYPTKIYPKEYSEGLLVRFHGLPLPLHAWMSEPLPAQFIAMGFLFTEGVFHREIPFDPNIYFFGDDITTAARAYSHGYRFFHPHRIVAWHLYDRATRRPHWEDHQAWCDLNRASLDRVSRFLRGESWDEFTRLGGGGSVREYERFVGYPLMLHENHGRPRAVGRE